ncbi:glycosyltransferase family 4 protein [Morganella morganii]|uniref:Glycosyltransferase family 4 protein n=1 Tax=bacterium 19GA11TI05 TaxID=2920688 RepID=A0AAU6TVB4_UNCXX|nr:glycosyltransferase family 4 protein [Morganella morganii]MDW7795349.1 glycosyltransferase family 4 protein [Morganella morganii]
MKIALIGTTAISQLNFRKELIKKLVSSGHDVFCFSIDYSELTRKKIIELGAIPVDYQLSRSGINPFSDIVNTIKLYFILKQLNLDLVLSYFSKPAIFGSLAAKLAKVPQRYAMLEGLGYCFTEQPDGLPLRKKIIKSIQIMLYKISFSTINGLILLNKNDHADLVEKYKINVDTFIWGGIGLNLDDFIRTDISINDRISFLFIGRLLKEKGIYEIINAASKIKQIYPEVEFIVLGDIDKANPSSLTEIELKSLINHHIITYPGFVKNIQEWISKSNVFVLPSYREGLPRSTQEAMAMGLAIITTDVPGCRDTVIDGLNGLIIQPWSSQDLYNKMVYLINNPDLISQMGKESYSLARNNYDQNKTNKELLDFLRIY